jgi:hypothetical protein
MPDDLAGVEERLKARLAEEQGMKVFHFEAMDARGMEIKDTIEAKDAEDAQATIRQMGYFVTKIVEKSDRRQEDLDGTFLRPQSYEPLLSIPWKGLLMIAVPFVGGLIVGLAIGLML